MLKILRGDYTSATRNQLKGYKLERPARAKDRWAGISHYDLVNGIITAIKDLFNLHPLPDTESYAVSPQGTALIGGFSMGTQNPRTKKVQPLLMSGIPQETYQAIGFQHSNDCRKALNVYCGATVALCTNGMVHSSYAMRHKHTTGLTLEDWLKEGLENIWTRFSSMGQEIESLFHHGVRPIDHEKMLVALARQDIIPWRLLGEVDEAWNKACDGEVIWSPEWEWSFEQNAWDWYNCVTHVAKKIPPAVQLPALERAFRLTCELLPKKERPNLEPITIDVD